MPLRLMEKENAMISKAKRCIASMILIGEALVLNPSKISMCHHLAELSRNVAVQRDAGVPKELVMEASKNKSFHPVIESIYKLSQLNPYQIYQFVYSHCIISVSSE